MTVPDSDHDTDHHTDDGATPAAGEQSTGHAHDALFPSPVSDPPRTGDPAVDRALAEFAAGMVGDVATHPEVTERLDEALRSRLADVGGN